MTSQAATSHNRGFDLGLRWTTLFYLGVMVALPLFALCVQAAQPGLRPFRETLADPYAWHALKLTFVTALVMVAINAVTGTATAWVLVRYDFPGRSMVNALIDLPFAVPTVVTGVMLVVLYGPSSVIGTVLGRFGWGVIYQQPGIVLALLFVSYPFVIRSVQPVLMELDRAEEEAAATLGAGAWTRFHRVTLPALWPSILTGSGLSFSRALGEFGSVVMVAGNHPLLTKTAPLYIYGEIESGNRHAALVVSAVLLASSLLILVGLNAMQRGEESIMAVDLRLDEPGLEPPAQTLGQGIRAFSLGRWLLTGAVLAWFAILILVPTLALVRQVALGGLSPFLAALARPEVQRAFAMTLGITALATAVNTVFGIAFALVLTRQRFWGRALVDGMVDMPFAISPIVAGLMLIVLYGPDGWLGRWLEPHGVRVVYAVPGMILATMFVTVPFVVRELVPVLRELGEEYEQAAHTLGASRWRTFWSVTLPSIRWGVAYGVTLTVARSLGEFGAVLVVSGNVIGHTQTATLYIDEGVESFHPEGAYAASLVLAVLSFILLVGMDYVRKHLEGGRERGS